MLLIGYFPQKNYDEMQLLLINCVQCMRLCYNLLEMLINLCNDNNNNN